MSYARSGVTAAVRITAGTEPLRTPNIFESILADEEHHIDYLETQLALLEQVGEQLYLAQLLAQPSS